MKALSAGVYHYMTSVLINKHLKGGEFLAMAENNEHQVNNNVLNILVSVRGTPQFWYRRKTEVMTMICELGPPTWFVTLSAGEYYWIDIEEHLRLVNLDMPRR